MERPSHTIFNTHKHPVPRSMLLFGLAISLQVAAFWLLTTGLGMRVVTAAFRPFDVVPVADPVKPREAPPEPNILKHITPPIAQAPVVQIDTADRGNSIVTVPPDLGAGTAALVPDHAATAIRATHTIPPYPPVALRMGAEGRVTLRLTVLPDGRVGQADIVDSSGRQDLDEATQQWIVGHW
ncbi:MAG TPA: TonB family protein, partial [Rhizomicrobium sp.]|nr:TonB family protein [Rhizomicrobium sp.]